MTEKTKSFEMNRRTLLGVGLGTTAATLLGSGMPARAEKIKIGFALETSQIPRWKYLDLASFK
ncbi:MAG TPA: hypothetical protein VK638_55850, partial [Edaphobacter sp.]|nr:hypothetical protein [Edaphobacter sp.]